jgi:hypothetical protein
LNGMGSGYFCGLPALQLADQCFRTPYAIVDQDGRIFVMLCGRPKDEGWDGVTTRAADSLLKARETVWTEGCQRRGKFVNASKGVTLGPGGQVIIHLLVCKPYPDPNALL